MIIKKQSFYWADHSDTRLMYVSPHLMYVMISPQIY